MSANTVVRSAQGQPFWVHLNPFAMAANLWSHREITWQLAKRDILVRYRQTRLGLLWSIITPLALLAVYTFAFATVFGARWTTDPNESPWDFALTMFCGLLLYGLFAEVANRAPGMVVYQPNYVKRVVFPLEVFVVSGLISALINMLIGYGVWLVGWGVLRQAWPHWTAVCIPLLLIPVCLTTAGIAWVLASLGVFVRDVGHAVIVIVQMLFFATPIFYSMERVPERFRWILELNPLAHAIEGVRGVLIWGRLPNWPWLGISTLVGAVLAVLGYAFFMKSKRAFADVV